MLRLAEKAAALVRVLTGLRGADDRPLVRVAAPVAAARPEVGKPALMLRMLACHGISAARLDRLPPGRLAAMAATCTDCGARRRCACDLDNGVACATADEYCPNSDTICALGKHP